MIANWNASNCFPFFCWEPDWDLVNSFSQLFSRMRDWLKLSSIRPSETKLHLKPLESSCRVGGPGVASGNEPSSDALCSTCPYTTLFFLFILYRVLFSCTEDHASSALRSRNIFVGSYPPLRKIIKTIFMISSSHEDLQHVEVVSSATENLPLKPFSLLRFRTVNLPNWSCNI